MHTSYCYGYHNPKRMEDQAPQSQGMHARSRQPVSARLDVHSAILPFALGRGGVLEVLWAEVLVVDFVRDFLKILHVCAGEKKNSMNDLAWMAYGCCSWFSMAATVTVHGSCDRCCPITDIVTVSQSPFCFRVKIPSVKKMKCRQCCFFFCPSFWFTKAHLNPCSHNILLCISYVKLVF